MKKQTCSDILSGLGACSVAVDWSKQFGTNHLKAWKACNRGDHLLWYAGKLSGPVGDERRKKLVLAACGCARLALPLFEKRYPDDKRVRDCIETAEKWARNEATLEAFQVARRNCYSAAAYASAAAAAAADASPPPTPTTAAAYAAAYAAIAAAAAAYAAADAPRSVYAYADARSKTLAQCADIVRKFYPTPPKG